MSGPNGCFNNDVKDVVIGMPLSNHDHSTQAIQFLHDGRILIAIRGFTNGGIAVPDDKLGGFPSNPLAGAIFECPTTKNDMMYTNSNPLLPQIQSGGCKTYATGFRNMFAMEFHTNGRLYATDDGPNDGFGELYTDCTGGQTNSKNMPDNLIFVEPGKCHRHPCINRGINGNSAECALNDPRCLQPLISNVQSSTYGVVEYRSNVFGNKATGNLFMSKYNGSNEGRTSRAGLDGTERVASNGFTNVFWGKSGLSVVEGRRGELIMSRVFKNHFFVLRPNYSPKPATAFFNSVLPKVGPPDGGTRTMITGRNFEAAPSATFRGKACTYVKVIDDDAFTCVTTSGTAGEQVAVVATELGGGVGVGVGTDFWYF